MVSFSIAVLYHLQGERLDEVAEGGGTLLQEPSKLSPKRELKAPQKSDICAGEKSLEV